jgi:E3 SUMO-protein ligase PIAS1
MSLEPVLPPYNSSEPGASFLSSSALDFLLIELVPLAYRVTSETPQPPPSASSTTLAAPTDGASTTNNPAANGAGTALSKADDEETLDAVKHRLETAGYRVGQGLVERYYISTLHTAPSGQPARKPFTNADGTSQILKGSTPVQRHT